jgi:hypothetical protein
MLINQRLSHLNRAALCSYICPICDRYQALPYNSSGYRCPVHGIFLRRERSEGHSRMQSMGYGLERALSL